MSKTYQQFKTLLFNPKTNKKALFNNLKLKYTFKEQQTIVRELPKSFMTFIVGNCLLKEKVNLGLGGNTLDCDYEIHLNWFCLQIDHFSSEINKFLALRDEFEKKFLLGEYEESAEIIRKINSSISYSNWSIENEFLQVQFQKGLEFNFKLLNASQKIPVTDSGFFFLLHFFSSKVEEDISYFNYQTKLTSSYIGVPDHYINFFNYRLNPLNYSFNDLNGLFSVCSNYSVVDKYLLIRDVLVHLSGSERSNGEHALCLEKCCFLNKKIDDPLLTKIIGLLDDEKEEVIVDNEKIDLLDLYTEGKYYEVIILGKIYLLECPNEFSVLELYVKSHIHLQIELQAVSVNDSFLNSISKLLFAYLTKKEDPNEKFVDLLTQANVVSNFDFSQELVSFLERNIKVEYFNENNRAFCYSKSYNPLNFGALKGLDKQKKYLLLGKPTSLTQDFFLSLINDSNNEKFKGKIPKYRHYYYKALTYFVKNDFQAAKVALEKIIKQNQHLGFQYELIVLCLFKCYVNLEDFNSAINLYVETYLMNEKLVLTIDCTKAVDDIVKQRFRNVFHSNVNFPIFMYLSANEAHVKFIAYDLFMRSVKANRPTELFSLLPRIGEAEMHFLRLVSNSKIISRKAVVFKNSLQVIKERIEICQALSKIDIKNLTEYSKEISELTKRLTVQQRIKEIDQSMIYVDENGIIGHELSEINKGFNRFRNISELMNLKNIDATGISYDALLDLMVGNIDTDTYKKSIRKTDIHFELFIQLFIQVRDKFLFSNYYGLDYYLSQRIRHGTIIGQLRKPFQELNLVTSKSSEDGDYLPSTFWSVHQLGLEGDIKEKFEARMAVFSANIDAFISELKDRFIQIKTEDAKTVQSGWFGYMYIPQWHKDVLYSIFIAKIQLITDFNEFVNSIFEILWDMTAQNLKRIRTEIDEEVKFMLISYLDELEADLTDLLDRSQSTKLMKNIADCRTNTQSGVDVVIRWFNRSKNDEIDFTLADAFNTSLQIVNNINSPFLIFFSESLETETMFKGAYFTHFVDLLKIFITNIFNYFKENNLLSQPAEVKFHLEQEILIIDFINPLAGENLDSNLEKKMDEIKLALLSTNYTAIRGEGKSGFYKANNILKNVFRDKSNEIVFDLHDNTFNVKLIISVNNLLV
ncbi:hypothetical protein EZ449_04840 [Pedobacter frigidisoli]|uniref:Uncharacterized protein n=1 Tax=Pedobacter frigidisoli TaxID=2530455 RepID=A0A4V2MN68_9SPHI|nr:hypothetical protein [Pedobacter frigidisoli]TCD11590.1 hypothetical protein EZ449_04840 [Pedobacter frigidisoli]